LEAALAEAERRFTAVSGRFNHSQATVQQMQDQLREMGNELTALHQARQVQPTPQRNGHVQVLTPKDREDYGEELIGFAQRAAREAIFPELQRLREENAQLRGLQVNSTNNALHDALDRAVPAWREIFANPRFAQWLSLPDIYSNRIRSDMLREAAAAGQTARVVSFYQGFLAEEAATGQNGQLPGRESPPAPRPPAVPAMNLAAPGRGSPAASQVNPAAAASGKPILTRAQVTEFYDNVRRGRYAGRQADKDRDEAIVHSAVAEGRVL
jgi:hypothetical protein